MNWLAQLGLVSGIALRSVPQRLGSALVIVAGTACVVAVLLSMLSVNAGVARAALNGTDPARAVVHPIGSDGEWGSALTRGNADTITDAPGVLRRNGKPVADAATSLSVIPPAGFVSGSLQVRTFSAAGMALHPGMHLTAGRMFQPGLHELVMGIAAQRHFGFHLGDKILMPGGPWPIVGAFSSSGEFLEGVLLGDADTVLSAAHMNGFGTVTVQLQNANAFPAFAAWVNSNPTLKVLAERQADFNARRSGPALRLFERIAYAIAIIMGLGALFGTFRISYAAVRSRTREMGTLRTLGFAPWAVGSSVLVEAVVLSTAGAVIGVTLAWLVCNTHELFSLGASDIPQVVSAQLMGLGLLWGVGIALLGGLVPALRAARLTPAGALRAA